MRFIQLGEYGPQLMFIMSLPILWTKKILLNYILVGFCLNNLINFTLKYIFKCPRPNNDNCKFHAIKQQTSFIQSIIGDPFGFPSGHAQNAFYLTIIIYQEFGVNPITILYGIYSVFIMWQRVYTDKHYITQVIAGAITGAVIATCVYYSYKNLIIGNITHKIDDWSNIF